MNSLQTLDYIAIAIYMLLMAGIGLFLGRFVKNIGDYFKGGNSIPWVSGAISNFMTKFSTFIFVAYAGIAYSDGVGGGHLNMEHSIACLGWGGRICQTLAAGRHQHAYGVPGNPF